MEFVYRLVPPRRATGKSGAGFAAGTYNISPFGSSDSGVHTAPPPIGMSEFCFHVSAPGSPGLGTMLKRQTGSPSDSRNAPIQPRIPNSLTAGPTNIRSSYTRGGMEISSPVVASETRLAQSMVPEAASSARRYPSAVARSTRPSFTATPRLARPPVPASVGSQSCRHRGRQVAASIAMVENDAVKYMVPSCTTGPV